MAKKQVSTGKKKASENLRINMIRSEYDEDKAITTKSEAQKILSLMFAALHKRGRPKKNQEELPHAV